MFTYNTFLVRVVHAGEADEGDASHAEQESDRMKW